MATFNPTCVSILIIIIIIIIIIITIIIIFIYLTAIGLSPGGSGFEHIYKYLTLCY